MSCNTISPSVNLWQQARWCKLFCQDRTPQWGVICLVFVVENVLLHNCLGYALGSVLGAHICLQCLFQHLASLLRVQADEISKSVNTMADVVLLMCPVPSAFWSSYPWLCRATTTSCQFLPAQFSGHRLRSRRLWPCFRAWQVLRDQPLQPSCTPRAAVAQNSQRQTASAVLCADIIDITHADRTMPLSCWLACFAMLWPIDVWSTIDCAWLKDGQRIAVSEGLSLVCIISSEAISVHFNSCHRATSWYKPDSACHQDGSCCCLHSSRCTARIMHAPLTTACPGNHIWDTTLGTASTGRVSIDAPVCRCVQRTRAVIKAVRTAVSEDIIKATADIMIDSGLKKAGYEYLVIDGDFLCYCWSFAI